MPAVIATVHGVEEQIDRARIVQLLHDSLDEGNCSKLPKITEALLHKGYSKADIRKILGENTLRVMEQAERVSRELQSHR